MQILKVSQGQTKYLLDGLQVFSVSELADLIGKSRKTVAKNIEEWGVNPSASDERYRSLFKIEDYIRAEKLVAAGNKFGGYADAIEYRNAIAARRDELRLEKDEGMYCEVADVEQEMTKIYSEVKNFGNELLTIVDNYIHPSGEDMELINRKFRELYLEFYRQVQDEPG